MPVTRDALVSYISKNFGVDATKFADDDLLFSTSVLDSFSMVDMITWIEGEGGFRIAASDVSLENLDSIGRIMDYCGRQTA